MAYISEIEKRADEVLKEAKLRKIPIAVEDIASHFKLRIGRASSDHFSGMLLRKDGTALIGVNSNEAAVRQRFTIAHELGHFFLHPNNEAFVDYRMSGVPRTGKERDADTFAAALLMPASELAKDFSKAVGDILVDEDQMKSVVTFLAKRYEVSDDAMRIRLMNLGRAT